MLIPQELQLSPIFPMVMKESLQKKLDAQNQIFPLSLFN